MARGIDLAETVDSEETPKDVLKSSSARYKILCDDAQTELYSGNTQGYVAKLQESAKLIASLPDKIKKTTMRGQVFPHAELQELIQLAFRAQKALEDNNTFAMGVLLIDKGSTLEDPNRLDRVIERVYPTQTAVETA